MNPTIENLKSALAKEGKILCPKCDGEKHYMGQNTWETCDECRGVGGMKPMTNEDALARAQRLWGKTAWCVWESWRNMNGEYRYSIGYQEKPGEKHLIMGVGNSWEYCFFKNKRGDF